MNNNSNIQPPANIEIINPPTAGYLQRMLVYGAPPPNERPQAERRYTQRNHGLTEPHKSRISGEPRRNTIPPATVAAAEKLYAEGNISLTQIAIKAELTNAQVSRLIAVHDWINKYGSLNGRRAHLRRNHRG
jgi:hypothetical protein